MLFFFAQKKGNKSGYVNVVSTQNYAAQLNAVMEAMGYPIPSRPRPRRRKRQKREAPCSTREVLERARDWLDSLSDGDC